MRVARNLIENARVDSIDSMIICLRLIDELGKYLQGKNWDITTIKEFAPECIKEASSALGLQLEEEKEKCAWMKINPEYEEEIKKAEKLAFFGGAIRFLYKDAEGQEDWGNFAVKLKN